MNDCKPISTPVECEIKLSKHDEDEDVDPTFFKSLVRNLHYLTCIRLYILYVVGLLSQYMENPKTTHFKATKKKSFAISKVQLIFACYTQFLMTIISLDIARVIEVETHMIKNKKSTIGFVFFMGDTTFT